MAENLILLANDPRESFVGMDETIGDDHCVPPSDKTAKSTKKGFFMQPSVEDE